MIIRTSNGTALDANFAVEVVDGQLTVVIESRGGTLGTPQARNTHYVECFELILARLGDCNAQIVDAFVDSKAIQHLPIESRRLVLDGYSYPFVPHSPRDLQRRFAASQARVGRRPDARGGGNRTKRVRLVLAFDDPAPSTDSLEACLGGTRGTRVWVFRFNPTVEPRDETKLPAIWALPTSSTPDIRRGDRVVVWRGGRRRNRQGVIALGEIVDDSSEHHDSDRPASSRKGNARRKLNIRYMSSPRLPLRLYDHQAVLGGLAVAQSTASLISELTSKEWHLIVSLTDAMTVNDRRQRNTSIGQPYAFVGRVARGGQRAPFEIDPNVVDRGNQGHASTQDALARHLWNHGIEPRSPVGSEPDFDLAWEYRGAIYIAEVKSTTAANEEKQLRLGLGQVLRYHSLLADGSRIVVPVLVPEQEPGDARWMGLCDRLGVLLAWPDEFAAISRRLVSWRVQSP